MTAPKLDRYTLEKAAEICRWLQEANQHSAYRGARLCEERIRALRDSLPQEPAVAEDGASRTPDGIASGLLHSLKLRCGYIINGYGEAKMEAVEMERLINDWLAAAPASGKWK